jgi:hypothetical protein
MNIKIKFSTFTFGGQKITGISLPVRRVYAANFTICGVNWFEKLPFIGF